MTYDEMKRQFEIVNRKVDATIEEAAVKQLAEDKKRFSKWRNGLIEVCAYWGITPTTIYPQEDTYLGDLSRPYLFPRFDRGEYTIGLGETHDKSLDIWKGLTRITIRAGGHMENSQNLTEEEKRTWKLYRTLKTLDETHATNQTNRESNAAANEAILQTVTREPTLGEQLENVLRRLIIEEWEMAGLS